MLSRFRNTALALIAGAMSSCASVAPVAVAGEPNMNAINSMDRAAFVQKFGGIFEKSPWVAEKAWDKTPFTGIAEMHAAMVNVVKYAPAPSQLALLHRNRDPVVAVLPLLAGVENRRLWTIVDTPTRAPLVRIVVRPDDLLEGVAAYTVASSIQPRSL